MTKADFVMRAMYGDPQQEIVVTMERRAALAIEACEEWDRGEGLEGEANNLRQAWCVGCFGRVSHIPWDRQCPEDQKGWLAVARKAREIHGKEGV